VVNYHVPASGSNIKQACSAGAEDVEDDGEPFTEKKKRLSAQLRQLQAKAEKLDPASGTNY